MPYSPGWPYTANPSVSASPELKLEVCAFTLALVFVVSTTSILQQKKKNLTKITVHVCLCLCVHARACVCVLL